MTKEITEWFFDTQPWPPKANQNDPNMSNDETHLIITMAVPGLVSKMFEIINQMYVISKDINTNIVALDGMKKLFSNILNLYETHNARDMAENDRVKVDWNSSPPIDAIIRTTKFAIWKRIKTVSIMIHTNLFIISIDDELTAFDFGIWPKNDICLIFSLKIKLRKLPCLFYLMNSIRTVPNVALPFTFDLFSDWWPRRIFK